MKRYRHLETDPKFEVPSIASQYPPVDRASDSVTMRQRHRGSRWVDQNRLRATLFFGSLDL